MRRLLPFAIVLVVGVLPIGARDALTAQAAPDCICRAQGREFHLGETACIATPNGPRRATCGMVANVTSWKVSQTSCVVAARMSDPVQK